MKSKISIKEDIIETLVDVNSRIVEFEGEYDKAYFEKRCHGKEKLLLVGYFNDLPVGYLLAYDRDGDNSMYCWLAGVDSEFRRLGILSKLMEYLETWSAKNGYKKIKIKTRNKRREMLAYLVKQGFYFVDVEERACIEDNRILLEKLIISH
jgi:ribosomal protein S18 acetylase RimI-like enzyme